MIGSKFVARRVDESFRLLSEQRPMEAISALGAAKFIEKWF
jgi:hypothetical protein